MEKLQFFVKKESKLEAAAPVRFPAKTDTA